VTRRRSRQWRHGYS